ncbi:NUDIX domain-containing protein, partial [Lysobacter sp. 2RAB21]
MGSRKAESDGSSSDSSFPVSHSRVVEVVAGVIRDARGRILLSRRTEGRDLAGLWEFPGGKREPGETAEAALEEYRRFCFLAVVATHTVTPSETIDKVWHAHMTDTRDYWLRFCPQVLKRDLHHTPS